MIIFTMLILVRLARLHFKVQKGKGAVSYMLLEVRLFLEMNSISFSKFEQYRKLALCFLSEIKRSAEFSVAWEKQRKL